MARVIECPLCGKKQADEGKHCTCEKCGMSPLPSSSYPKDSSFHPDDQQKFRRKKEIDSLYEEVKELRRNRLTT